MGYFYLFVSRQDQEKPRHVPFHGRAMDFSLSKYTKSEKEARLASSLRYQRSLDAAKLLAAQQAAAEREQKFGNADASGRVSLMKPTPVVARVSRLSYWAEGVPTMPWRDAMATTLRYAPRSKRPVKAAYATI